MIVSPFEQEGFMDISQRAAGLQFSLIRKISEEGMKLDDIIPLWFGEGCWPTSDIAVKAASEALATGNHFYQPNNGAAELRQEIRHYIHHLYGYDASLSQITVTASGMQGLALTAQAIASPGDEVICVGPVWPNLAETFKISGADVRMHSLVVRAGRWELDMDRLLDALHPGVRAVLVNSPNNPTGWVMSTDEQKILLDHCRLNGIWIIADDVYARLSRGMVHAPSFLSLADAEDRLISVNSFSKAWSMTGWRLGFVITPATLEATFAKLTEFSIACPAGFIQAAGVAMLRDGEPEVKLLQARVEAGYEIVRDRLQELDGVSFIQPDGAFYSFFSVDGVTDSLAMARSLLHHTKVGLAPGRAFGPEGEGHLRLCYAQEPEVLIRAFDRLESGFAAARNAQA